MGRLKNDGKGKFGGRKKGTPNKLTSSVREWLSELIDKNREQIERDIEQLDPKDRLQVLERLMQYVIPKQQAVRADVDFSQLTDEDLDLLVSSLTKGIEDED
jgi:uncharacterized protein (UPF0305 family)